MFMQPVCSQSCCTCFVLSCIILDCQCDATGTFTYQIANGSVYAYCPENICRCRSGFNGKQCQCGYGRYDKNGICEGISHIFKSTTFKFS